MHQLAGRLRRTIRAVGPWVILVWILGAWGLTRGATLEAWDIRRRALDRQFDDSAQQAASAEEAAEQGVQPIRRDPGRQYFFVPPEMLPTIPLSSETSANPTQPDRAVDNRHAEYAERLFQLAGETLADGQSDVAYRWVHEVLRFDPQHVPARRIVGLKNDPLPRKLTPRPGRKPHPRFGWPARQYRQLNTPHFRITTNDTPEAALQLAYVLEELHAVWRQCFLSLWSRPSALQRAWRGRPLEPDRRALHQVVLFRDREEYLRFLRQIEPQAALTLGYYHAPSRTAYFFRDAQQLVSTWRHEATHQLLHECLSADPNIASTANMWVVEGVAVYMESLRSCQGYRTVGGLEAERLQYARYRALRGEFYRPLLQLAAMGRDALQQDPQIRPLYSQAAGLTHFLMDGQRGRHRAALMDYLQQVYAGPTDPRFLERATQESTDELDRQYLDFLRVDDDDLRQLDPDAAPIHLSLGQTAVTDGGLRQIPAWNKLIWLDLAGTRVTDQGFAGLEAASQLQRLSLEATTIGDATVRRLAGATHLEELDLRRRASPMPLWTRSET